LVHTGLFDQNRTAGQVLSWKNVLKNWMPPTRGQMSNGQIDKSKIPTLATHLYVELAQRFTN
jgi:hypothetical protein